MALFEQVQEAVGLGEKVLLCHISLNKHQDSHAEFLELATSSGVQVIEQIFIKRHTPEAQYFIGSGKVEQIAQIVQANNIEVVLFSKPLSPSQQRNLERAFECRVMDRTGLILDIFALRAQSFEGKLQVELAQLKHMSTRLIRGWTHLERQKGGLGLRGPGETQLETDRRLIQHRINHLKTRLEKVDKQRHLARQSRIKNQVPVISLVGYTNAGKSSLFNALTQADIYTDDKLFATLDTTLRNIILPACGEAIIADTVGFIQDLPHDLVAAFKSTLDETRKADVLLHVVDVNDDNTLEKIHQVNQILTQIGADEIPTILVMNKIDLQDGTKKHSKNNLAGKIHKVWLSAQTGEGLELLQSALSQQLSGFMTVAKIRLAIHATKFRSEIYKVGFIRTEKVDELGRWILEINVTHHYLDKLLLQKGIDLLWQQPITPQPPLN